MNVKTKAASKSAAAPWGVGWSSLTAEHRNALVVAALVGQLTIVDLDSLSTERRASMLAEWQDLMTETIRTVF